MNNTSNLKNKLKKVIFIISVNIVTCLVILFLTILCWDLKYGFFPIASTLDYLIQTTDRLEQDLPFDEKAKSIVVMGCSFAYGKDIETEDTLAYKLQKYSKRKVYNYAYPAHGIQYVLYKLQYSPFFEQKDLNPEYVIYVFINDHLRRMYCNYFLLHDNTKYLRYIKTDKNELKIKSNPMIITPWDFFTISPYAREYNHLEYELKSKDEWFDFLKLHLEECQKELHKRYKDAKFVVVVFNSEKNSSKCLTNTCQKSGLVPFHTTRWKELEDEGFVVIDFDKPEYDFLNDDEYETPDEMHPNGKAWDSLVPEIANKLGIKKQG